MILRIPLVLILAAALVAGCAGIAPRPPSTGSPSAAQSEPTFDPTPPVASPSPTPTPTQDQPTPSPTTETPTMPPFPSPLSLLSGTTSAEASDQGGCSPVYFLANWVTGDQCGPHTFKLDAVAHRVARGGALRFTAPRGWSFSTKAVESAPEIGAGQAWTVTIAPIAALAHLPVGQQETIPLSSGGRVLGTSHDPTAVASVRAPIARGEYLVQLRVDVFRDGWTWVGAIYFWRISIR